MVGPISNGRRDKKSSFRKLLWYLTKERDPLSRDERARGIVITNGVVSIETADIEMQAVADQNKLCGDPLYHFQISWRPGERPSQKQWHDAAERVLRELEFQDHQYVIVAHEDRAHFHIHIMVNRIHPETYRAHSPYFDILCIDRVLRQIEHEQGWSEDVGTYRWDDEQGKPILNSIHERAALRKASVCSRGKAGDFERFQGAQSVETYAKDKPAKELSQLLTGQSVSWQDVHGLLQKHGLRLFRSEFGGYTVGAVNTDIRVKASRVFRDTFAGKVNRQNTERKLGEWQPPTDSVTRSTVEHSYAQTADDKRVESRKRRAEARAELKRDFQAYRATQRDAQKAFTATIVCRRKDLYESYKQTKKHIRERPIAWTEKKSLLSQAAFEYAILRGRLSNESKRGRLALEAKRYQMWIAERAENGDKRAAAQLRGWRYQDHRNVRSTELDLRAQAEAVHLSAAEPNRARTPSDWDELSNDRLKAIQKSEQVSEMLSRTRWIINSRTGHVSYAVAGKLAVVDRGRALSVVSSDDAAVLLGLEMAQIKFGSRLSATGSAEWREHVARTAVRYGINVEFTDAQMNAWMEEERLGLPYKQPRNDRHVQIVKDEPSKTSATNLNVNRLAATDEVLEQFLQSNAHRVKRGAEVRGMFRELRRMGFSEITARKAMVHAIIQRNASDGESPDDILRWVKKVAPLYLDRKIREKIRSEFQSIGRGREYEKLAKQRSK